MKSELGELRDERASSVHQSVTDLQSRLTRFEEQQTLSRKKLEEQTSTMSQLQLQVMRIEQLCLKLNETLSTRSDT